jgi:hypothetical protein
MEKGVDASSKANSLKFSKAGNRPICPIHPVRPVRPPIQKVMRDILLLLAKTSWVDIRLLAQYPKLESKKWIVSVAALPQFRYSQSR